VVPVKAIKDQESQEHRGRGAVRIQIKPCPYNFTKQKEKTEKLWPTRTSGKEEPAQKKPCRHKKEGQESWRQSKQKKKKAGKGQKDVPNR